MLCAPLSMLGGLDATGCDELGSPVHGFWDKDVSVAGVYDCVKECMSFVM